MTTKLAALLILLLFASMGASNARADAGTAFSYADPQAKAVFLAGGFNDWKTSATPMLKDADGAWRVTIPLKPGTYRYKFFVDGRWVPDPANPAQEDDGLGGKNSVIDLSAVAPGGLGAEGESSMRTKIRETSHETFLAGKYQELDGMAKEFREKKARLPSGLWKLPLVYGGIYPETPDDAGYKKAFALLDAWIKASPESITPRVAKGNLLTDYAWLARGNGYANSVTNEGWLVFGMRLSQARQVLDDAGKLKEKCPEWFTAMQTVALGQGWNSKDYEALYHNAVAFEPTYYDIYFQKAYFLLPKWNGSVGDWERFAEDAAKNDDPKEGMSIYARVAWAESDEYSDMFKKSAITWEKMKQGFRDMMMEYPDSQRNLNAFCRFAFLAQDRDTVKELLARIGDHPDLGGWGQPGIWESAVQWAKTGETGAH